MNFVTFRYINYKIFHFGNFRSDGFLEDFSASFFKLSDCLKLGIYSSVSFRYCGKSLSKVFFFGLLTQTDGPEGDSIYKQKFTSKQSGNKFHSQYRNYS